MATSYLLGHSTRICRIRRELSWTIPERQLLSVIVLYYRSHRVALFRRIFQMNVLDRYDFAMIRACKRNGDSTGELIKIWEERCGGTTNSNDIPYHLVKLIYRLNLIATEYEHMEFVKALNPDSAYNIHFNGRSSFITLLWTKVISVLALARVDQLPGYAEWLKTQK